MENLKQLVDRLTGVFLPAAVRNQSFFVNDVPSDLPVDNNPQWIAAIISRMLSTVINHVKDTSIRLTAKRHGHEVIIEMRESGCVNGYAMASELQQVNSLAERVGGHLSISLPKANMTAIAFCFPNIPSLAE